MAAKSTELCYKGHPLRRKDNLLYYGSMADKYIISGMPVGGKTGTTTNNCDRWFVGFTPYYVAAVWTGYDMPEYMNFSGNPAAQIWKLVMESIHKDLPTKSFPTPTIGSPTGIFGNFSGQSQDTGGDADAG